MKTRSIGARLTFWYACAFAASLAVLGLGMWLAVRHSLYHAIDESLRERVRGIHTFLEDHKTRLALDEVKDEFHAHGDLFEVIGPDGVTVHRSESLPPSSYGALGAAERDGRFMDVTVAGAPLRFLSETVEIDGRPFAVHVAAPLRDLQRGLRDALLLLAPLFPLALVFSCAGGYWMSRRALAPVDRITQTARSIGADNLAERLAVPATGDELARLSETLNEMIERLETAFTRTRRFTADASHELRTPLAVMRTTAEVALRNPQPAEHRAALEQITAEIERTSQLVENFLLIAKADSGHAPFDRRPVDVGAAVDEACSQARVLAHVKRLELAIRLPQAPVHVTGDRDALRRLFLILLDNAVKFTAPGGKIEVSVEMRDGRIIGAVADTGIGISAEDVPHIFDRFYRADRARSRELGGVGLGLAIGRWITEAHGGQLSVETELARGSRFTVELPHT